MILIIILVDLILMHRLIVHILNGLKDKANGEFYFVAALALVFIVLLASIIAIYHANQAAHVAAFFISASAVVLGCPCNEWQAVEQ
jgi:hypothetical protein